MLKLSIFTLCLIAGTLIIGCNNLNKQTPNSENNEIKEGLAQENKMKYDLCFRNEYPYQNSTSIKDVEELKLFIDNGRVTGFYNWLPAEKDKREGSLTGTVKNNVIEAVYTYTQEGVTDTAGLKIIVDDYNAIISGGKPESGLNISIKKIECSGF